MDACDSSLHLAMCPWFALGHITPYFHMSNKLARKGHRISFLVPYRTQRKLEQFNHFPNLITFIPFTVAQVDGLPSGAETTSDVPSPLFPLIMASMDRTRDKFELLFRDLKPDIIFFDFAYWIPKLARPLGIKTVYLSVVSPVMIAYCTGRELDGIELLTEQILLQPPPSFPDSSSINILKHETKFFVEKSKPKSFGDDNVTLFDRFYTSVRDCDIFASKGCREIEGPFIEFIEGRFGKPVLLAGPIIPEPPITSTTLEEKWATFLSGFEAGSVIYCGFGSERALKKKQFQELLLGLELSGLPFLAALKPPTRAETVEEALPEGFEERVGRRGVVDGGWIQQQLILEHPSVGCYVTHCGSGSLMEGLVLSKCQLVMIPYEGDQIFNSRLIGKRLKAGVEVEVNEENGFFTRESICKAIRTVMEENYNEVGKEVRANCAKLRELLLHKNIESSCIDNFSQKLKDLFR